jgi:hypothetical protein
MDRFFPVLELALIVAFLALLVSAGTLSRTSPSVARALGGRAGGPPAGLVGLLRSRSPSRSDGAVAAVSTAALAWVRSSCFSGFWRCGRR